MKKGLIFISLFSFLFLGTFNIASANFFGGRIISTKALEIATLEASGFICSTPGTSISILPIGSPPGTPNSYIIPYGVSSRTGFPILPNQKILGAYGGIANTTCILYLPPPAVSVTVNVPLNIIPLYGNSKI